MVFVREGGRDVEHKERERREMGARMRDGRNGNEREKRKSGERRQREYKMIFFYFFIFLRSCYSGLLEIAVHCRRIAKFIEFKSFDGVCFLAFIALSMLKFSIYTI